MSRLAAIPATAALLLAFGCSQDPAPDRAPPTSPDVVEGTPGDTAEPVPKPEPEPDPAPTPAELAESGRSTYMSFCIACHNVKPKLAGAIGPDVAGSSAELLEARVVHGTYPEGYTPKRDSTAMVPMPHLESKIPALAAFLAQ